MSKIIVLDDEVFDSLVGTLKQAMDDSKCLQDWLNAKAHAELIESQKDKKRSVIEWHDWGEKIPDEISEDQPILMRWKDPMLKEFVYDVTTKYDTYGCQEWAVLPELPSED
jgi:hypothetical protein